MAKAGIVRSGAGRHQEIVRTGPGYRLAEYLNDNWDVKVGRTNQEVADLMNYKSPNIISMFRTGRVKVSLERLPEIADLMKVDLVTLLPLWVEQYLTDSPAMSRVEAIFKRLTSINEFPVIKAIRSVVGKSNPDFSEEQLEAIKQIVASDAFAKRVLDDAKKDGAIRALEDRSDSNV